MVAWVKLPLLKFKISTTKKHGMHRLKLIADFSDPPIYPDKGYKTLTVQPSYPCADVSAVHLPAISPIAWITESLHPLSLSPRSSGKSGWHSFVSSRTLITLAQNSHYKKMLIQCSQKPSRCQSNDKMVVFSPLESFSKTKISCIFFSLMASSSPLYLVGHWSRRRWP